MSPSTEAPEITVSIASYNTRDLLSSCLTALRARQAEGEAVLQVIVADNGSVDGTLEMVSADFPEVTLLETGGNLGYGRANNAAFQLALGRHFCALNSDADMQPGALAQMREYLDEHPNVGAVGARLIYPDGSPQTSYGTDPTVRGIFEEQTFWGAIRGRILGFLGKGDEPDAPEPEITTPTAMDQIAGACQFFRAAAFAQVGGYDPAFFMYHEDVELNQRLRKRGWGVVYLPDAVVVHHLGASSQTRWQRRARMVAALNWSRYHAFTEHEGAEVGAKLKRYFILGAAIRLTAWTFIAMVRPSALDRVRLFRVVLRRAVAMTPEVERRDPMSGIR